MQDLRLHTEFAQLDLSAQFPAGQLLVVQFPLAQVLLAFATVQGTLLAAPTQDAAFVPEGLVVTAAKTFWTPATQLPPAALQLDALDAGVLQAEFAALQLDVLLALQLRPMQDLSLSSAVQPFERSGHPELDVLDMYEAKQDEMLLQEPAVQFVLQLCVPVVAADAVTAKLKTRRTAARVRNSFFILLPPCYQCNTFVTYFNR